MRQSTLAEAGFQRYNKRTRRERFLEEMERVVPWEALVARIEPVYYPKRRGAGRPAAGLERMLRIHFLQHWFNLSDPGVEEALYDCRAMRQLVGIDLGREARAGRNDNLQVSPLAGSKRTGRSHLPDGWGAPEVPRTESQRQDHRGCGDNQRAQFDQEPGHAA